MKLKAQRVLRTFAITAASTGLMLSTAIAQDSGTPERAGKAALGDSPLNQVGDAVNNQIRQRAGDGLRRAADQISGTQTPNANAANSARLNQNGSLNTNQPLRAGQPAVAGQQRFQNGQNVPMNSRQAGSQQPLGNQRPSGNLQANGQFQNGQSQNGQAQRGQWNNNGSQQISGSPLAVALVDQMRAANKTEIELATMARDRADNEQLKQLASTMITDHEKLRSDLEKASQTVAADRNSNEMVPQALCDLKKKACDINTNMVKEMLTSTEGQDFQMAFLGQQIFAHQSMIAELEAINQSGPSSVKPIAQQTVAVMKKHLDAAKSLAHELEHDHAAH